MRVVCILNKRDEAEMRTAFAKSNLVERENFLCFPDFEKAKNFLVNCLVNDQQHVDVVVISEALLRNNYHQHLVDWVRFSLLEYSSYNFKLAALPIIKYDFDNRSIGERDNPLSYTRVVTRWEGDNQHRNLIHTIGAVIKHFRSHVLDDLDDLDIDFRDMSRCLIYIPDVNYVLRRSRYAELLASKSKVLSQTFIATPKKLKYDWLIEDASIFENALDKYEHIIKRGEYNRQNSERRVLHGFYNKNRWALRRDVYAYDHYEPRLTIGGDELEIPDYILSSPLPKYMPTTVFEVKLSDIELIGAEERKPVLRRGFTKALRQLYDYRAYLEEAKHKKVLEQELLGYVVDRRNLKYKLLAGNDASLHKNESRIRQLLKDHYSQIEFITHDDQLRLMENYYKRLITYGLLR